MARQLTMASRSSQPLAYRFSAIVLVAALLVVGCGGSSGSDDPGRRAAAHASAACSKFYRDVVGLGSPEASPTGVARYVRRIARRVRLAAREISRAATTAPAGEVRKTLELQGRLLRSQARAFERDARRVAADRDTAHAATRFQRSLLDLPDFAAYSPTDCGPNPYRAASAIRFRTRMYPACGRASPAVKRAVHGYQTSDEPGALARHVRAVVTQYTNLARDLARGELPRVLDQTRDQTLDALHARNRELRRLPALANAPGESGIRPGRARVARYSILVWFGTARLAVLDGCEAAFG